MPIISFAGAVLLAGGALAGEPQEVRGKIVGNEKLIPDVYSEAANAKNHRFNWREASLSVDQNLRILAGNPARELCIAALQPTGSPTPAVNIRIGGGRANPTTIVVSPKTKIVFKNTDPFPHRLYQMNADWKAVLKPHGPQEEQRDWVAPDAKGSFEIRDEFFPSVRVYIVVEPRVVDYWFPSRAGNFAKKLPPGDYVLQAYFAGKPAGKEVPVHMTDKQPETVQLQVGGDAK